MELLVFGISRCSITVITAGFDYTAALLLVKEVISATSWSNLRRLFNKDLTFGYQIFKNN